MFEFAAACIGLAGVFATAAAAIHGRIRKRLWQLCALFSAAAFVLCAAGVYHRDVKSVAAPQGGLAPSARAGTTKPKPNGESPSPSVTPAVQPQPAATENLSDSYPVDEDSKAGTSDVEEGGYEADGTNYDHAIKMNAGCENGDGGDMWADWNLDRKWSHLTGTVALEDDATTGASITYAVYLDGRKAASGGPLKIGQSAAINLNVSGVYRVRLWMNDPASPTNDCGTSPVPVPNFIWGNLTATS